MPSPCARLSAPVLIVAGLSLAVLVGAVPPAGQLAEVAVGKIGTAVRQAWGQPGTPLKVWVFFADKRVSSPEAYAAALAAVEQEYNPRAVQRRRLRRTAAGLFDAHDLPVAASYVDAVTATGAAHHITSRWLNAISVYATRPQIEAIARLPFVRRIERVYGARRNNLFSGPVPVETPVSTSIPGDLRGGLDYGVGEYQLEHVHIIEVHELGFTGDGMVVGILDTGFDRSHEAFNQPGHLLQVVTEWDFIDNDGDAGIEPGDPDGQHSHGTCILGIVGGYKPGSFVGAAYDAAFILCKTEDTTAEYPAEEDNYVAGLEFAEMNGADLVTTSLGYIDWYTQDDLDGQTAITTLAVNIATANGMPVCTAAGNGGNDYDPNTSHLIAPADAFQVITVGALVGDAGGHADFTSDGPTADGRVKPEVMALGVDTRTVSSSDPTGYVAISGTSASTPIVAGAVACLLQAYPTWTVDELREHLFYTARYYRLNRELGPYFIRGYGRVNAFLALHFVDCNRNTVTD
ncbi:MAG: S8 family serine peptidase, partial [Planctomycetes bacterium]|nr:S8 family serine peptidase [Planctomycetota bacterium]